MAKRRRRVVIGVLWVDTVSDSDNSKVIPCPMVTFGELTADEPDFIRIASEIHADGGRRDHVAIPKGSIRSIIRVGSLIEPKEFIDFKKEQER